MATKQLILGFDQYFIKSSQSVTFCYQHNGMFIQPPSLMVYRYIKKKEKNTLTFRTKNEENPSVSK